MSDPKHPPKLLIIVANGKIMEVLADKKLDAKVLIANYDMAEHAEAGVDLHGYARLLYEKGVVVDTAYVRNTINKKGNKNV